MRGRRNKRAALPALDLIEAAVRLLRSAPGGALLCYYVGSVPCLLALLYWWADMTHGALAREHAVEAAFNVMAWFLWMKCWQAAAASKWRAHLLLQPEPPWTLRRIGRLVLVQAALQPSGLLIRPLAAQLLVPYVWCYSFYQNVTVLGDGTVLGLKPVAHAAARQAGLWLRQAHAALGCLFGFAFFVWLNVTITVFVTPMLLRMFLGVETFLSRSPGAMVNSTTLAATLAGTYLCFDPLRKALFVLRCHHGAALKSGDDLFLELKLFRRRAGALAISALVLLTGLASPAFGAEPPPPAVESGALNDSLDRVLQRREYTWRMPRRETVQPDEQKGWLTVFFEEVWKRIRSLMRKLGRWMSDVIEWLQRTFRREPSSSESTPGGEANWSSVARWTLYVLGGALALLLGVLLWRSWRGRKPATTLAQPIPAAPDLRREEITADLLPEDGWLGLAREMMARGDLRLALRAFYLAGLAHLGGRELILIARHKSNRDYDQELRRRARTQAGLPEAFAATILEFERAWYGDHPVDAATLDGFTQNLEKIRAC